MGQTGPTVIRFQLRAAEEKQRSPWQQRVGAVPVAICDPSNANLWRLRRSTNQYRGLILFSPALDSSKQCGETLCSGPPFPGAIISLLAHQDAHKTHNTRGIFISVVVLCAESKEPGQIPCVETY